MIHIENIISISGISIAYKSGYIVTIGNTSDEPDLPLNKISRHEFVLAENEVIVKITKYHGTITAIKFFTNLGNEFDPTYPWLRMRNTTECIHCYVTYSIIYFNIRITMPFHWINVLP
jgi:hypothetical protein